MPVRKTTSKPAPASIKRIRPFWAEIGNVVQLVSGGLRMTVEAFDSGPVAEGKQPLVTCLWARYGDIHREVLPLACLRIAQADDDKNEDIPF